METQMTSYDKTVKAILAANFQVSIMETPKGKYYVEYGHKTDEIKHTNHFTDLNLANMMFQMICIELQGN